MVYSALNNSGSSSQNPSSSSSRTVNLNANVSFDGIQFTIQNKDTFDWSNIKLEVNPEFLKSGYIYNSEIIMEAGEEYTVGVLQFVKKDGTRFNPIATKPMTFEISCDTPNGKGTYSGEWK